MFGHTNISHEILDYKWKPLQGIAYLYFLTRCDYNLHICILLSHVFWHFSVYCKMSYKRETEFLEPEQNINEEELTPLIHTATNWGLSKSQIFENDRLKHFFTVYYIVMNLRFHHSLFTSWVTWLLVEWLL